MTKFPNIFKQTLLFSFVVVNALISCGKKGGSSSNIPTQPGTYGPLIATVNNVSVTVNGCAKREYVCCRLDYTGSGGVGRSVSGETCSNSFTANFTSQIKCSGVWSGSVTCKNTSFDDLTCEGIGRFAAIAPTSVS